jgi:hypothetical protein
VLRIRAAVVLRGGRRAATRTLTRSLAPGARARLVLPFTRAGLARARAGLRRGRRATASVRVEARDAAGNAAAGTTRVTGVRG